MKKAKEELMTLTIVNVDEEFLPAFKALAKGVKAKVLVEKNKEELIKELEKESQKCDELYKKGKLKTFKSMQELRADLA